MKSVGFAVIFLFFTSCTKEMIPMINPQPKSCKIATATYMDTLFTFTYTLTYNDSGNLVKLVYDGLDAYVKTFQYYGKMIYMYRDALQNPSTDTVTFNDAGQLATSKETTMNSVVYTVFTYGANGQLLSTTSQQNNDTLFTTTYIFKDGDRTNTISNGVEDTTSYDGSKQSVIGNLDDFNQMIYYGSYYYRNKHLKQYYSSSPFYYTYTYTFDSDGKITQVVSDDGQTKESFTFTYRCQ